MSLSFDTVQQVLRIALFTGGGVVLGDSITNGPEFQTAVGGVISIAAFCWWFFWERNQTKAGRKRASK